MITIGEYPLQSGDSSPGQAREHPKVQHCSESCLLPPHGKKTRWQRLIDALIPYLKSTKQLSEQYAEAVVHREQSEAHRVAEQAAEIAARKDLIRQKEVQEFSRSVDEIFVADGLPPIAKALKLAKLMESNPHVEAHIGAAKEILKELPLQKFMDGPQKSLPCERRNEEQG